MGAWGAKSFDNDDALDWIAELEEASDTAPIKEALEAVIESEGEYLEAPECSTALAAAEVIAALKGAPGPDLSDEVNDWVGNHKQKVSSSLIELALKAINRIKTDSELKGLWDDTGDATEWYQAVGDLEMRLKR
jgi:Domain of unknown function (DUF4259)